MKKNEKQSNSLQQNVQDATHFTFRVVLKAIGWVFNILFTILLVGIIAGCIVGGAFLIYVANNVDSSVDDIVMLSGSKDGTTRMYHYENGELVEDDTQRLTGGTNKLWISYDQIPDDLINAFIAIEDKRFWDHDGVDWITTIQAAIKFVIPTGSNPGGSTITQQLIKNATGDDDYTIQRKVQEIFKAMNLEKVTEKKDIMEMYLNSIYLSQGCTGVQAAANKYFSKDASELTLIECAAIAGITQNPIKWDPVLNPKNNSERRNNILREMYNQGLITRAEFEETYKQDLVLNVAGSKDNDDSAGSSSSNTTSWYTDAVIEEAIDLLAAHYDVTEKIAEQMLYSGGYNIVTAIDPDIQAILEKYYEDMSSSSFLPTSNVVNLESSMLVMDPYNGNIVALVGGRGEKTDTRLLNRATMTKRQPGSSMKPIGVYAPAMDAGIIHYGSTYKDSPYTKEPSPWPQNSNRKYTYGPMTMEYAIAQSKNTIAVKVLADLGVNNSFRFLREKLHMASLVESVTTTTGVKSDKNLASLALGGLTYGVTLKEMVAAYSVFPSGGIYSQPRTVLQIQNSAGQVLIDNNPDAEIVLKEGTAQSMVRLMESVITEGTATSAREINNLVGAAGKTGTTDDNNDRWFVGYTPYYAAGIWIGYDEPQNLANSVASAQHVKLWNAVMVEIHEKVLEKVESGEMPKKTFGEDLLIEAKYCKSTGMLPVSGCSKETGYFTKSTLPSKNCTRHS